MGGWRASRADMLPRCGHVPAFSPEAGCAIKLNKESVAEYLRSGGRSGMRSGGEESRVKARGRGASGKARERIGRGEGEREVKATRWDGRGRGVPTFSPPSLAHPLSLPFSPIPHAPALPPPPPSLGVVWLFPRRSNVVMLKWMIAEGYGDVRTMKRRIASMEAVSSLSSSDEFSSRFSSFALLPSLSLSFTSDQEQ